jgi:2-methylcitrate dehydratase PrpD
MTADPLGSIAEFVCNLDIVPDQVRHAAELAIIDYLGVAAIGAVEDSIVPLRSYVTRTYAPGGATGLGTPTRLTVPGATYLNGTVGHVLDYDDYHDTPGGHPTAVIMPALLALAEVQNAPAAAVVTAYAAGVEVMCALGRALNHTHYERGWHPTATLGIFAATAACARLRGLDLGQTARALGIAASFASGLKGNFGTSMKSTQVGHAAENAVQATALAELAASSNVKVLAGGAGSFAGTFNAGVPPKWSELGALGHTWETVNPGLVFKLYPCCGSTHAAIDAARQLRLTSGLASGALREGDITRIEVRTHPRRLPHTNLPFPLTGLGGKFSIQYCVARALLGGDLNHRDFTDDAVTAPEVRPLLALIDAAPLAEESWVRPAGRADCFATSVAVCTASGGRVEEFVLGPKGFDPAIPVTRDDIERKFLDNVELLAGHQSRQVLDAVTDWLAGMPDARPLSVLNHAVSAALPGKARADGMQRT